MYKKIAVLSIFTTLFINIGSAHANEIDNRERITDTITSQSSEYTGYLDMPNSTCTAVMLNQNTALTAAHCIKGENKNIGSLYPAQSSELFTPLGVNNVDSGYPYNNRDVALLKWSSNSTSDSTRYYIGDKKINIKVVKPEELLDKKVYTIGYPGINGGFNQYKSTGKVTGVAPGIIQTDLSATPGQSGSGVFLEETNDLIGIVSYGKVGSTSFAPIDSNMNEWIQKNMT